MADKLRKWNSRLASSPRNAIMVDGDGGCFVRSRIVGLGSFIFRREGGSSPLEKPGGYRIALSEYQRDRAFEKLFRLQRKLGSYEGWEAGLQRPNGMWQRTYERHFDRDLELDAECAVEMMAVIGIMTRLGIK
jgi:hypothetical protein